MTNGRAKRAGAVQLPTVLCLHLPASGKAVGGFIPDQTPDCFTIAVAQRLQSCPTTENRIGSKQKIQCDPRTGGGKTTHDIGNPRDHLTLIQLAERIAPVAAFAHGKQRAGSPPFVDGRSANAEDPSGVFG